jgi:hypothetical protein
MRDSSWIVDRGLTGLLENFLAKIGMRLKIPLLGEHHKHSFARINEHPALDLVEQPFGQATRQVSLEAQPAGAGLLTQGFGLLNAMAPRCLVVDVFGWGGVMAAACSWSGSHERL